MTTFVERAQERGYRIQDIDNVRHVSIVRGNQLYGMTIYSLINPSPDRWEAVIDQWDELLGGRMKPPPKHRG